MHTFRLHGLVAPEPPRLPPATFGRQSRRRYGRRSPAAPPVVRDDARGSADDMPQWVDQDFEETTFE